MYSMGNESTLFMLAVYLSLVKVYMNSMTYFHLPLLHIEILIIMEVQVGLMLWPGALGMFDSMRN